MTWDHFMRFTFLLLVFLVLPYSRAESNSAAHEAYERGEKYFQEGDYRKAYEEFLKAFEEDPGDLETNFAMGRAAFEMGDYETAAMAFERLLMVRPGLNRVKLELARCYFRLESYELARRYFQDVLDTDPPNEVRRNIEVMMENIAIRTRRSVFAGLFSTGYTWDSNVLVRPGPGTIETGRAAEHAKQDTFFSTALLLDHRYRVLQDRGFWWRTTLSNYNSLYDSENDLNINYFSLTAGPAFETQRLVVETRGLVGYMLEDQDSYFRSSGGIVSVSAGVNEHLWLTTGVRAEDRKFYGERQRDAFNMGTDVGSTATWGLNRLTTRVGFENNDAKDETESYDRLHALVRYQRKLPFDFTAFAGYRFDDIDYYRRKAEFDETRRDYRHEFSVGLGEKLWRELWGELSYFYIISDSCIELYDYDRHLVSFGLSWMF